MNDKEKVFQGECDCLKKQVADLEQENAALRKKATLNREIMAYLEHSAGYVQWLIRELGGKEEGKHDS
mgnify:CR=1 FL=1